MSIFALMWKEIWHRKINFGLSLAAVTVAVAFVVAFLTTAEASKRETIRLMRDMGYNLRVIAKDTDMDRFYAAGYSGKTMPEEFAYRLAQQKGLLYAHLLATLQQSIPWRGREVLLTGIAPELSPPGQEKSSMIFTIEPGTVYVGYQLAQTFEISPGDSLEIQGKTFTVRECLGEMGNEDDIRILAALSDVQKLLGMEGRINEIQALNCYCLMPGKDPLEILREQLTGVLPEAQVILKRSIADARTRQRELMENYFSLVIPGVAGVCAVWIGTMAFLNARERREEVGILRALGRSGNQIAALFLGKAVLIGLAGAVLGFFLGTAFALHSGPEIFKVTAKNVRPMLDLLSWSLIAAPLFTAVASFIPALLAATQDPAEALREE